MIDIEIVYALPDKATVLKVQVPADFTVELAIEKSGIVKRCPEIDLAVNKIGIWNRTVKLNQPLRQGDRIEIYRPLIADPKDVRRRRAEKAKLEGRANKITGGRV